MSWPLAIVCYHRILPEASRRGDGRPYFERGTAVSDVNFAAQVRSLTQHFDVVSAPQVLDWLARGHEFLRPSCWITFDDGYRDVVRTAAPILRSASVTATAFVTTGVVDVPGQWLPADQWYATLNRAIRRRGVLRDLDGRPREFDLERDYLRLVDGPERRAYLTSAPAEQSRDLACLAEALGAANLPPADLYLDWSEVTRLAEDGWTIGGHGASHAILTRLPADEGTRELAACRDALRSHGLPAEVFAYPDGAHDARVAAWTEATGWNAAVALERRTACRADSAFTLPRFIPTDDPAWVDGVLRCTYARTVQA